MKEKFLFCEELRTTTKAKDVFQFVKDLSTKHELDIQSITSVCTDALLPCMGNKPGLSSVMK